MASTEHYDIIIIGAGIAGTTIAHALSTLPRPKPLRIALLERSLAEPDRIVGELLQPGGMAALESLGMGSCLENIDAVPVLGYCVYENGKTVHIPYPAERQGRSFHHGKFIMALRDFARTSKGVELIEANVSDLIEENDEDEDGHIIGVTATRKDADTPEEMYADLVIVADGCFSNFRSKVCAGIQTSVKSHFVAAVLEDTVLPIPNHGTVVLVKGYGPVLLYQISTHHTRLLVDVKAPLPTDLKAHILNNILPQLPPSVHISVETALAKDRLRRMPNSCLSAVKQGEKRGAILLGDAWNMRHPLTGGGMTVAFADVVLLRELLGQVRDMKDWREMRGVLRMWHARRKGVAATVNILSLALYDLFGADDEELGVLRTGCFKYFERGGECVNGPVSLLSAITPSPLLLFNHFFSVAFYSIWVMFTHPQPVLQSPSSSPSSEKPTYAVATVDQYPRLLIKSVRVFQKAVVVFAPLLWAECAPTDPSSVLVPLVGALLVALGSIAYAFV